jgi:parallel beta-helix repeat protein
MIINNRFNRRGEMQVLPRRRVVSLVVCIIIVLAIFTSIDVVFDVVPRAKGAVIYVGGTGGGNHSTIESGINAANPGDTVYVYNGTYYEAMLTIDKTISLVGEHRNTTKIINNIHPLLNILSVEADFVNITGFNITDGDPGIIIFSNYTIISKCFFFSNSYGIEVFGTRNISIIDNIFSSHGFPAVKVTGSDHNISNNEFINDALEIGSVNSVATNNTFLGGGVIIHGGTWNNVYGNHITKGGITVRHWAHDNYIMNNTIIKTSRGIFVWDITTGGYPYSNFFVNNTITDCTYGIIIGYEAGGTEIIQNHIFSNGVGIYLEEVGGSGNISYNDITGNEYGFHCDQWGVKSLIITNNTISYNNYGFYFDIQTNNQIYHNNIINNTIQVYDDPGNSNQWDNGYPSGGNFWSDYNGSDFYSGPNQDILGSDGIGDTPYVFNFSQDNYPLMEPQGNLSFLREGWNFVSVPWIQSSTDIEDVLSQLNGSYNKAVWYNTTDTTDHWKSYYPSKPPYMNDLKTIDHTMGFGIQITEPGGVVFDFKGTPPTSNQTIPLYEGWNMVGYPSLSNQYRPDALNNLVFGIEVDAVWTYNSGAQKWEEVGDLNYFVVGKGYWIHATQDCVWEMPL